MICSQINKSLKYKENIRKARSTLEEINVSTESGKAVHQENQVICKFSDLISISMTQNNEGG